MIDKIKSRIESDTGATFTVEFIFIILVVFFLFMAMIDLSMYSSVRGQVQSISQDAVRTAAIHGGDSTPITRNQYKGKKPSAQLKENLDNAFGTDNKVVKINKTSCSPTQVKVNGPKTVTCTVEFTYNSLSPEMFRMTVRDNKITMSSESEVWW